MSIILTSVTKLTNDGPRTYYYVQFRKHIKEDLYEPIHCGPAHKQESWDTAERLLREHLEEWHNHFHNRLEQLPEEIARKKASFFYHTMDANYFKPRDVEEGGE